MHPSIIPSTWENCGTCERWGGSRTPRPYFMDSVAYDMDDELGECMGGGHNRLPVRAMFHCYMYKKWSVLK
jgi:hypothetical protein